MMPFGAAFRAAGLRINEYGPKTLALVAGDLAPPASTLAGFAQHMVISWTAAAPLIVLFVVLAPRARALRIALGAAYGAGFYVVVNSLALPLFFDDPTPWQLGFATVLPSLVVHLVYGAVAGFAYRAAGSRAPRGASVSA